MIFRVARRSRFFCFMSKRRLNSRINGERRESERGSKESKVEAFDGMTKRCVCLYFSLFSYHLLLFWVC